MSNKQINPIDELIADPKDLTLDAVVQAEGEMSDEELKARIKELRTARAKWVRKGKY